MTDCGNAMQATVQLESVGVEGMVVHQNELADHAQVRCTVVPSTPCVKSSQHNMTREQARRVY